MGGAEHLARLPFAHLGWVVCLAGLPWSFFLLRSWSGWAHLDIWHSNTWWMQGWVPVLAALTARERSIWSQQIPQSAWWLVAWTTVSAFAVFYSELAPKQPYPMALLVGIGNLWVAFLALWLMTQWTPEFCRTVSSVVFWSGVSLIGYAGLQACNLDQFFRSLDTGIKQDVVVGTIGNPTHFACQLTLWMPFAMQQSGWRKLWLLPAAYLIVTLSSSTALMVMAVLLCAWAWTSTPRAGWLMLGSCGIAGGWVLATQPLWLDSFGRWPVWSTWWDILSKRPILGWGVGFTRQLTQALSPDHPLHTWRHLHNEYFQWWVETGVIGMLLLGWFLWSLWQRRTQTTSTPLRWAFGWSFAACLLVSILNFPWHLWQLGGWGLAGLAGWLVLTGRVEA